MKTAVDLAQSGGDSAASITALRERLQTLREQLLALREEVTTLREEKHQLANRLAERDEFAKCRDQYVLTTLSTGAVVYVPRGAGEREEPLERPADDPDGNPHQQPVRYCATCFDQRRLTPLQPQQPESGRDPYAACPTCATTVWLPRPRSRVSGQVYRVPRRNRWHP